MLLTRTYKKQKWNEAQKVKDSFGASTRKNSPNVAESLFSVFCVFFRELLIVTSIPNVRIYCKRYDGRIDGVVDGDGYWHSCAFTVLMAVSMALLTAMAESTHPSKCDILTKASPARTRRGDSRITKQPGVPEKGR